METLKSKAIALVDCDSFFASCEQLMNPSLLGKPVCVLSNNDGCVVARSKEAKALGIKMAMPAFMAKKQFPQAVYLSGRLGLYGEISARVMQVLNSFSPAIEIYSIDEAFIDLSGLRRFYKKDYYEIAKEIRKAVKTQVGVPVSVGISGSKTLAKLAAERAKSESEGVYQIALKDLKYELKRTKIGEVWGIGKNSTNLLNKYGISNAYQYINQNDLHIQKLLGKKGIEAKYELSGESIYQINFEATLPKSIQKTSSFATFTTDEQYIKNSLNYHIHRACKKLRKLGLKTQTVGVMLRTKDFRVFYTKLTLFNPSDWEFDIYEAAISIFNDIYDKEILYRSSGIILSGLNQIQSQQLSIFNSVEEDESHKKLASTWDRLESKYGRNIITVGRFS